MLQRNARNLLCGHCGMSCSHSLQFDHSFNRIYDGVCEDMKDPFIFMVYECSECSGSTVLGGYESELEDSDLYPKPLDQFFPQSPHLGHLERVVGLGIPGYLGGLVPKWLEKDYESIYPLIHQNPEAFALQIRRIVEKLANKIGAVDRRNLHDKINYLKEEGFIPDRIVDSLHSLRVFGNEGAHGSRKFNRTESSLLDSIFRDIVNYIYISPAKIKGLKKLLSR